MAFTKVVGPGIHTLSNITSHNVHSSGIITATRFDGPFTNLNVTGFTTFAGGVSIGGTLTYEDVTNIDSVGIGTFREGIFIPDNKKAHFGNVAGSGDLQIFHDTSNGSYLREAGPGAFRIQGDAGIWIQSASSNQDRIVTNHNGDVQLFYSGNKKLNTTNTGVEVTGILTATSFSGDGSALSGITAGYWGQDSVGVTTNTSAGINTSTINDSDLVGVGNSFQGLYISNGMMIMDNKLSGNHYIGTAFNGLMAGPVIVEGTLTVEGNYVVV